MAEISVIIPWCNRYELGVTLPSTLNALQNHQGEILLVNCGGRLELLTKAIASVSSQNVRVVNLPGPFHKTFSMNIGAYCSIGNYLLLLDADVVLNSQFVDDAVNHVAGGKFVSLRVLFESMPREQAHFRQHSFVTEQLRTDEFVCADGRVASIFYRTAPDGSRSAPGILLVQKQHYLEIGGHNSKLSGWGFEDFDLQLRFQFALGLTRLTMGEALHISHTDQRRSGNARTRSRTHHHNVQTCHDNYARGDFLGTFTRDVIRYETIGWGAKRMTSAAWLRAKFGLKAW